MENPILAYIHSCDKQYQPLLLQLREIIRKAAPKETTETINYKMPTFRYNGNLIHFALNKQHIGLYPGSKAIEAFSKELNDFKKSKGAIHLALDAPLPEKLIQEIVQFNAEQFKDKKQPDYQKYYENWTEAFEIMERLLSKTTLVKEKKWGADVYTHQGKNVIGWRGFKNFFSIWFYNGVFLSDPLKVLVNASEGKTKALRQWRFTSIVEMNERQIMKYIVEAVNNAEEGKEYVPDRQQAWVIPETFMNQLELRNKLIEPFMKLTKGKQKDFVAYILEAKQEKTVISRWEKISPMILEGKGLNDKYKK